MRYHALTLACALTCVPPLASAQPIEPAQLLHRFTNSPANPNGALVETPDGSFYGVTTDAIYRRDVGGAVTIVARLTDGYQAEGALVRGPDGALYGVTQFGGSGGAGTVFRFDPASGDLRTLHAFDGANEGATPLGGLVVVAGQLYGVTSGVLSRFHGGTIFQVDPTSGATVIRYQFRDIDPMSATRAFGPSSPLSLGPGGLLYGTVGAGGAVYRFDPAPGGGVTVVHRFVDPTIIAPAGPLFLGPDNQFYGAATGGGAAGSVYRFDPTTTAVTLLRPFAGSGGSHPSAVVMTADGSLYGTATFIGNSGQVTRAGVFRLTPGAFAFEPVEIFDIPTKGSGGGTPLTLGTDGLLYGSARTGGPAGAGTLFRFDPAIVPTTTTVLHAFAPTTTWAPSAPSPGGDGFLYGTTSRGGASQRGGVYRLNATTGQVTSVADMPGPAVGAVALNVFNSTLTLGLDGVLYGTSTLSTATEARYRVVRVNPGTGVITVLVETTAAPFASPGFYDPVDSAMVRTPNGQLYFTRGPAVLRFDPTAGTVTLVAQATSPAPNALFAYSPLMVATDGQIYVGLSIRVPRDVGSSYDVRVVRVDTAASALVSVASIDSTTSVGALVQGADGALYASTFGDIRRVDIATGATQRLCAADGGVSFGLVTLTTATDGTLVGLGGGGRTQSLVRCPPSTGQVARTVLGHPLGRFSRASFSSSDGALYGATWDIWTPPTPGTTVPAPAQPGGALVRLRDSGPLPALDSDGDGLPSEWETAYGLDPFTATGVAGADGDPDGDGRTNAQELAEGTHPRGTLTRYFAEGATGVFFHTRFDIANPAGGDTATVRLRFLTDAGATVAQDVVVPAASHLALDPSTIPGLGNATFSTIVEADTTIAVDRTMTWDATGYGRHLETGILAPSTTWYFAEGSTSGAFSLFYLLQNPQGTAVTATVRYLRPGGLPPLDRTYLLPPASRTTIVVDADAALASTDVSAAITATAPIVAERAMYYSQPNQAFAAGHESAGVTAPATDWFLAEGATGDFFDLFLLLANPGAVPATVQVEYLKIGGSVLTKTYTVPAASRVTIYVDAEEVPAGSGQHPLANEALSMVVHSTNAVPIIVERTMWWPGAALTTNFWYEAHNSPGATTTATRWLAAAGESNGDAFADTYVLIANPSATPAKVLVTQLPDETFSVLTTQVLDLPAKSRTNIAFLNPQLTLLRPFSVLVESLGIEPVPIVVEHATYSSPGGVTWASGGNALAAPLP